MGFFFLDCAYLTSPTCNVVITPEVHFDVVPLKHHAALYIRSSDGHINIILMGERVHRKRLGGHRLKWNEICINNVSTGWEMLA